MKGVSLTREAEAVLYPAALTKLAEGGAPLSVPQATIRRNMAVQRLYNAKFSKIVRFHSTKRRILPGPTLASVPFGYKCAGE